MTINTDLYHGYVVFISTILFFSCVARIVGIFGIPDDARIDGWTWRNHVVSGLHGLLAGIWGCSCLGLFPDLVPDPGNFEHPLIFHMVVFCSGYFVYDFIDHMMNGKSLRQWEVTLHHIACISIFWYNWHTRTFIGHSFIALLVEGNSFFLHSRKLLRVCGKGYESNTYLICVIANFFTFFLFRVIPIMLVFHGCYLEYFRYPNTTTVFATFLCTTTVALINSVLLWRLIKTDIMLPLSNRQNVTLSQSIKNSSYVAHAKTE